MTTATGDTASAHRLHPRAAKSANARTEAPASLSLLLYAALLPLCYLHYEYPWLVWVQHLPVRVLLIAEAVWRRRYTRAGSEKEVMPNAA